MNSKAGASRRVPGTRPARAAALAIGFTSALFGCSVYDESLRQAGEVALVSGTGGSAEDGGSTAASGGGTGGHAGASVGGELIDAGASGDSGELPTSAGAAGHASGGSAGVVTSAGTAGMPTAAGSGGNDGTGGAAGGSGGAAGGAATAHELGAGKPTTASTQQPANPSASGNDGQIATRWSATTGALPQWWRVDLGDSHSLTQVSLQFENADRKYTYVVETSANDSTYTTQATMDYSGALHVVPLPGNVSARYVRITVTATVPGVDPTTGASRPTWASFWEVSVLGT